MLGMVEGHEGVVEMKLSIGQFRFPRMGIGNLLDIANRVVAQVADGAARQRRQAGHRNGHVGVDRILQDLEKVTRQGLLLPISPAQRGGLSHRRQGQEGISTEEGIAADPLSSLDTLKKKGCAFIPAQAQEGDHRGVSGQLPVDRDHRTLVGIGLEIAILHEALQQDLNKKKPPHRAHDRWGG